MDLFTFILLAGMCALFFYIGKNYSANTSGFRGTHSHRYGQVNQGDDEENELPLVSKKTTSTPKPSSEADSKQIDKLMRDLEEMKSREKKHLAQIQLLKSKVESAKSYEKPTPKETKPAQEEIRDEDDLLHQELEGIIGDKNYDSNEPLDEEQLSREIEQEMQNKALI